MKKNVKRAPNSETISSFNDIKNFINKNKTKDEKRLSLQMRETHKMPFKRYRGIKMHVLKKHEQNKKHDMANSIVAQTHTKKKLMTNIIENKHHEDNELKKNTKIKFSQSKNKSKFREGVLNLSRHFIKNVTTNNKGNSGNKGNKNFGGKNNFSKNKSNKK